jgi:hypothetical protein
MGKQFTTVLIALAILTPLAWQAKAEDVAATDQALARQVAELQRLVADQSKEISAMRAERGDTWLNERRAEEVKALIHEVLSDAETRASLLDSGLQAGWKNGFFLADDQGNFLLKFKGMVQSRWTMGVQDQAAVGTDDTRSGFELSRTRFSFSGHVIDPSWKYMIWTGYGSTGGNALLDTTITKTFGDGWYVTVGQFKAPMWREWTVSECAQQMVERSLINAAFSGGYTQGVILGVKREDWAALVAFNDGAGNLNAAWNTQDVEYAISGRGEYKFAGEWSQYSQFESWQGEPFMAVVGAGVHWQQGEEGTTAPAQETDTFVWSVDAALEFGGANLFAAFIGSHSNGETFYTDGYGLLLQGGYFVTEKLELVGRYEWGNDDLNNTDDLSILTVGGNYFFAKHALRLSADVGYAFNGVSATFASAGTGWQQDAVGSTGQVVMRAQMQLLF